jgi:hypothetical protein
LLEKENTKRWSDDKKEKHSEKLDSSYESRKGTPSSNNDWRYKERRKGKQKTAISFRKCCWTQKETEKGDVIWQEKDFGKSIGMIVTWKIGGMKNSLQRQQLKYSSKKESRNGKRRSQL